MKKTKTPKLPQNAVSKSATKIKTYVLTVSEFFPKTHNKAGLPTGFIDKIGSKIKKHTIRGNYSLWEKRIEEIQKGNAILSVRYWIAKPYNSKQKEVYVLDKNSNVAVQKIHFDNHLYTCLIDGKRVCVRWEMIAENDGLNNKDFRNWFKKYDLSKPMAIIHFTDMRY